MTARVVLDTNILVSALWSRSGIPANIVSFVLAGRLTPCYDGRIMAEYRTVLHRPKFGFSAGDVKDLLEFIRWRGLPAIAETAETPFADESDRKFYEVAKRCGATLITGNAKHFPDEPFIMTAAEFMRNIAEWLEGSDTR